MALPGFGRSFGRAIPLAAALWASIAFATPQATASEIAGLPDEVQAHVEIPLPPGIHVQDTLLEGPVFANGEGHTLYVWPQKNHRNGYSGEAEGHVECYDVVEKTTAGLMSPYPPGMINPELDKRPSCTDLWHPVLAPDGAEEVGDWTVLTGKDGRRQWAYEGHPVYTSVKDREPGDTYGGTRQRLSRDSSAEREPVGPPLKMPPGFKVRYTPVGILLQNDESRSVYVYAQDAAGKVACTGKCTDTWQPIPAPEGVRPNEEWSVIERAPGVRQWAFRGKPLYLYTLDDTTDALGGSDEAGWSNVYTQKTPTPPSEFQPQDTLAGAVLADHRGRTVYIYHCGDDAMDQLSCETPEDTQTYRFAACGSGDWKQCLENWPYVIADKDAESTNRLWTIMWIDPKTGRRTADGDEGALRVWAYRDRPIYEYVLDKRPGDIFGDGSGEARGERNGLKAIWLRSRLRL